MDESWKYYAKLKKPNTKGYTVVRLCLHQVSWIGNSTEAESRFVVAKNWEQRLGMTDDGFKIFFDGGDENVLKLNNGDGCTILEIH